MYGGPVVMGSVVEHQTTYVEDCATVPAVATYYGVAPVDSRAYRAALKDGRVARREMRRELRREDRESHRAARAARRSGGVVLMETTAAVPAVPMYGGVFH